MNEIIHHPGPLIIEPGNEDESARRVKEKGSGPAILAAAMQGGEREGATAVDRVLGLVAEKVFGTDVKNGEKLVLPLTAAIMRVARRGLSAGTMRLRPRDSAPQANIADTLWWMKQDDSVDGALLGDAALHYASGFEGKHIHRIMDEDGALEYCETMARVGYGRAISQIRSTDPRADQFATLVARFPDAVKVLSSCLDIMAA